MSEVKAHFPRGREVNVHYAKIPRKVWKKDASEATEARKVINPLKSDCESDCE